MAIEFRTGLFQAYTARKNIIYCFIAHRYQIYWEIFHIEYPTGIDRDQTFNNIFQLAHITRPVVMHKRLHCSLIKSLHLAVKLLIVLLQKVLDEQRNIALALSQRRHLNVNDIEPVVQIFTKGLRFDHLKEILIGSRHNPHIDANRLGAANPLEFALLQHPQQLGLHLQTQTADFI